MKKLLFAIFLLILLGIAGYCVVTTVDTNLTIGTLSGWSYLGSGEAKEGGYGMGVDSYGNPNWSQSVSKVGSIEVYSDKVYTPVPYWGGWRTLPFAKQYTSQGFEAIGSLDKNTVFKLYEKKYWFSSNYLVIIQ